MDDLMGIRVVWDGNETSVVAYGKHFSVLDEIFFETDFDEDIIGAPRSSRTYNRSGDLSVMRENYNSVWIRLDGDPKIDYCSIDSPPPNDCNYTEIIRGLVEVIEEQKKGLDKIKSLSEWKKIESSTVFDEDMEVGVWISTGFAVTYSYGRRPEDAINSGYTHYRRLNCPERDVVE